MDSPLISCICVAKNGLQLPVSCFKEQTYPNLELVIVHEDGSWVSSSDLHPGDDPSQYELVLDDDSIQLVYVPTEPQKKSLGVLHNIGVDAARGEYCIIWDDDDWYHPERVEKQFRAAQKFLNHCVVLHRWQMYDFLTNKSYVSSKRQWEGSLLAPTKLLRRYRYPDMGPGHDTKLLIALSEGEGGVGTVDLPHLYVHAFHENNTMGREHGEALMQWAEEIDENLGEVFDEAEDFDLPLYQEPDEEEGEEEVDEEEEHFDEEEDALEREIEAARDEPPPEENGPTDQEIEEQEIERQIEEAEEQARESSVDAT